MMKCNDIKIRVKAPNSMVVDYFCAHDRIIPEIPSIPALCQGDSYPIYMVAEMDSVVGALIGYYANRVFHIQAVISDIPEAGEMLKSKLRYCAKQMGCSLVEE